MIPKVWILVTDASRAHLYLAEKKNESWSLLESIEHKESRARNQDLVTDRPGRSQQSGNAGRGGGSPSKGSSSGMEYPTSPKEVEHEYFAKLLSQKLKKGLDEKAYQSIILVAGPQFLGFLREHLDEQVKKHVHTTIDKDYTQYSQKELEKKLAEIWQYI